MCKQTTLINKPSEFHQLDDKALVQYVKGGDDHAFEVLVKRYSSALYKFIFSYTRDHDTTDDILQNAFIKAYEKIDQFRGDASFKTWLYQIALNTYRNYFRGQERQRIDRSVDVYEQERNYESLEEGRLHQESLQILKSSIMALPLKQRNTLQLHVFSSRSFKEIANIMDCSLGTVKANNHLGIKALRKMLSQQDDFYPMAC